MTFKGILLTIIQVVYSVTCSAAVLYVDSNSVNPVPPYSDWGTAATNIQDAVDAADPGDQVLVTNGVYQAGGAVVYGSLANRVVVNKPITVQSVNGPITTTIQGSRTIGDYAVRCVYLTNNAVLIGFTLSNGGTRNAGDRLTEQSGGGAWCESTNAMISNCIITGNSAENLGGGVYQGLLTDCTISQCTAGFGGGAAYSGLSNCTLSANWVIEITGPDWRFGGGAYSCTLNSCALSGNTAPNGGGAACYSTLISCGLLNNSAVSVYSLNGGGALRCTLSKCTLSGNTGGGAARSALNDCVLTDNQVAMGGASDSTLNGCSISGNGPIGAARCNLTNCTLTGNSWGGASASTLINCTIAGNNNVYGGGGATSSTLMNCIVYSNTSVFSDPNYDTSVSLNYCCTTPLPPSGTGNIASEPLFVNAGAGDFHLQTNSPCIEAGSNLYVTFTNDIEGNPRIVGGTVDMGAYEVQVIVPPNLSIQANSTNLFVGYPLNFISSYSGGRPLTWRFGDATIVSNQCSVSHAWAAPGDYVLQLTVYDSSDSNGTSATLTVHVIPAPVLYVNAASTNPVAPYSSWGTAASNIQDAVDAASPGYHILVANGTYELGGRVVYGALTNRLAVNKPVLVQSVNGAEVTMIEGNPLVGDSAIRCVYLTNGAALIGFTLQSGATRPAAPIGSVDPLREDCGGGLWCESTNAVVANCVFVSNTAALYGGAVYGGTLSNCTLRVNSASGSGGGAYSSLLTGCLLSSNTTSVPFTSYSDTSGGGGSFCTLYNCTLTGNTTENGGWGDGAFGGGAYSSTLFGCLLGNNFSQGDGGGAHQGTLINCTLIGNAAGNFGGGAWASTVINSLIISNTAVSGGGGLGAGGVTNCTIVGNSSSTAPGGAFTSLVYNSIVYFNTAPIYPDYAAPSLNYCCTAILPAGGIGNFTNEPLFVNLTGGNFRLQPTSPCINSGNNFPVATALDLDGNPRIVGGTVDMGAYEFQTPTSLISYAWLQQYGLATDGSTDYTDPDGDGMNNWQEWIAGTNPTNALSALRLLTPSSDGTNVVVTWQSVAGVNYSIERSSAVTGPFTPLATGIPGQPGTTTFKDTNALGRAPSFYRVSVGHP